jgi:ubiquinone/menaquinone biosynthesis C-methylase UbiE
MDHARVAATFDQWAAAGRDAGMEQEHGDVVRQVLAQLPIRAGDCVLDLGCGNGWATRLLAQSQPGVSAVGVDVSPAMIERAHSLHSLKIRARFEVGPFEKLDFPSGKFHRVFSMEALYYAVDLDRALAEMFRVLAPAGTADVIVDYYKDNAGTACWPRICGVGMVSLSEAEWAAAFARAGFEPVTTRRVRDGRGAGRQEDFRPSECYPDWATWKTVKDAGSLWIQGAKRP